MRCDRRLCLYGAEWLAIYDRAAVGDTDSRYPNGTQKGGPGGQWQGKITKPLGGRSVVRSAVSQLVSRTSASAIAIAFTSVAPELWEGIPAQGETRRTR